MKKMKRNLSILSGLLALTLITIPVNATATTDFKTDDEILQENAAEMEASKEVISEGTGLSENWWETGRVPDSIKDYVTFVGQDYTMSAEQEEAGYILNSGYLISPEAYSVGDAPSVISGGVQPDATTGYVTFTASVPTGIHSQVFVNFIRYGAFDEYDAVMEEVNGYSTTLCLPEGTYIFNYGGLTVDNSGRYFTPATMFTVTPGSNTVVEVEVNDNEAEYTTNVAKAMKQKEFEETGTVSYNSTTPSANDTTITDGQPLAENEQEEVEVSKTSRIITFIVIGVISGFALFVIYIIYKKNKKEFRDFDD